MYSSPKADAWPVRASAYFIANYAYTVPNISSPDNILGSVLSYHKFMSERPCNYPFSSAELFPVSALQDYHCTTIQRLDTDAVIMG